MKVTGCANGRSIDANQNCPKDTDTTDMYRSLFDDANALGEHSSLRLPFYASQRNLIRSNWWTAFSSSHSASTDITIFRQIFISNCFFREVAKWSRQLVAHFVDTSFNDESSFADSLDYRGFRSPPKKHRAPQNHTSPSPGGRHAAAGRRVKTPFTSHQAKRSSKSAQTKQ